METPRIDVLVPTCGRPAALAVTLTAIAAQDYPELRIVVSDQTVGASALGAPEVVAVLRYLRARGRQVETWRHLPRRGMAEQRAFLLSQAHAPYCLFVDDDVILEPDLVSRLHGLLVRQGCGFAGSAVHGLSYLGQERPAQEQVSFWEDRVEPETVLPGGNAWARHHLHSAANLFHLQRRLGVPPDRPRAYRVAWVGGCVLFDTARLRAAGGFDFWPALPPEHCGEDVLAQLRVMARFGGCGMLPSGAYHMELPTTLREREVDAPRVLPVDGGSASCGAAAQASYPDRSHTGQIPVRTAATEVKP
ncbi:glycosyltransferase family 2 protein [Massilia sp. IC2-477]|uniref:glycosyltransferase family 2 protein n=1 Tax=Massilia sp. IC2-477 TaxID=2887198 RepID=UPI001D0FC7FE|nr:glycosyltransferase family 2 protein [Massilia sp. IC2-477]MCC2954714.1 glycosyltransferase family 2 protein [Massilia sp. IC2-477]